MVFVSGFVQEETYYKLDFDFVRNSLADLEGDYAFLYACTEGDDRKNDKWKHKGTQFHRIVLPYEKVIAMPAEQVRDWMLQLAKERLGLTEKTLIPAVA